MHAGVRAEHLPRPARSRLLCLLAALCLVAFGAPAAPVSTAPLQDLRGTAVVDAVAHAPALARAQAERLSAGLLGGSKRLLPLPTALPPALLLVSLLLLQVVRGSVDGASRRGHLVASAGRSPPAHS